MKNFKKILIVLGVIGTMGIGAAAVHASALPLEPTRFETSLAAPIGSTDTSMTLVSGTNNDGTALSGYECFTIDSNQPNVEDVCGTVNGAFVTNMVRGISGSTGTTSVTALASSHRRGADVKISDAPFLIILSRIVNQIDGFANPVGYDGTVATSTIAANRNNLADWGLVQDTSFNSSGAIAATTAAKGYVQLATAVQMASSTAIGSSGASLVIAAGNATSTGSTAAALHVIVANNSGSLDPSFLPASTTNPISFSNSTYFGSTYSQDIGKHEVVFSTTGTSTWAVPTGIHTIFVRMTGGGGAGSNGCSDTCGGGGGGGGYSEGMINITATSSLTIFVGAGGTVATNAAGNPGTDTTITTTVAPNMIALPGGGGNFIGSNVLQSGGVGGGASGGQLNSNGQNGGFGFLASSPIPNVLGIGGTTPLGQSCGGGGNGNQVGNAGCVIINY